MTNDNFIWFNRYKTPNNWILGIDDNTPFPYLNLIFNNINEVVANQDELKCIYCVKDVNYNEINKYCHEGSVFCPICHINTVVPLHQIPEPVPKILNNWHVLAFGLFAHRPISSDESDSDDDDDY
jgi:hypothetical protein